MKQEDLFIYHTLCARATLYPGKTIEKVDLIIKQKLNHEKENSKYNFK
jgi:hypothetical protein